jgi:hypothetical protein
MARMGDEDQDGVITIDGCDACAAEGIADSPVAETLRLSLRDLSADVAVCARHREAIEATLAATLVHARQAGRIPSQRFGRSAAGFPRLQDGEDREVIRAWARAGGLPVAASGTISAAVLTAYREAHLPVVPAAGTSVSDTSGIATTGAVSMTGSDVEQPVDRTSF